MQDYHPSSEAAFISSIEGHELFPHIVRLLARGRPISIDEVATSAGWDREKVHQLAHAQPGAEWDDDGRLVGLALTLQPTPHQYTVDGRRLYTWCAADTVLFTTILGQCTVAESTCPATGRTIRAELSPQSVLSLAPATAVISERRVSTLVCDLRAEVCDHGHFFASTEAASEWTQEHPEGEVVTVADALEQSRATCEELGWLATSPIAR